MNAPVLREYWKIECVTGICDKLLKIRFTYSTYRVDIRCVCRTMSMGAPEKLIFVDQLTGRTVVFG